MTSREQFEDKFEEITGWEADEYPNSDYVDTLWKIWDASRAAIEIELPEPCSPGDFCVDIPAQAHHEVIEAIESAGLKVKK